MKVHEATIPRLVRERDEADAKVEKLRTWIRRVLDTHVIHPKARQAYDDLAKTKPLVQIERVTSWKRPPDVD